MPLKTNCCLGISSIGDPKIDNSQALSNKLKQVVAVMCVPVLTHFFVWCFVCHVH